MNAVKGPIGNLPLFHARITQAKRALREVALTSCKAPRATSNFTIL